MGTDDKSSSQILRLREVCLRIGISRSSLYEKLSPKSPRYDKCFPKPFKLGASSIGFLESSLNEWVKGRVAASNTEVAGN